MPCEWSASSALVIATFAGVSRFFGLSPILEPGAAVAWSPRPGYSVARRYW